MREDAREKANLRHTQVTVGGSPVALPLQGAQDNFALGSPLLWI
jgi:hypothetical protein